MLIKLNICFGRRNKARAKQAILFVTDNIFYQFRYYKDSLFDLLFRLGIILASIEETKGIFIPQNPHKATRMPIKAINKIINILMPLPNNEP